MSVTDPITPEQDIGSDREQPPDGGARAPVGRTVLRRLVVVVVLSAALLALVLAVPSLGGVRRDLSGISVGWIAAGLAFELLSCLSFVLVFGAFFDEVPRPLARRVAWVEMGSGALLPGGGVTSYVLGGVLLRRAGMSTARIIVRSGGVFWLTSAVNAVAVIAGCGLLLASVGGHVSLALSLVPLAIVVPLAAAIAAVPWLMRAFPAVRRNGLAAALVDGVGDAWRAGLHPQWRLLGAFGYLGFDIAVLVCVLRGLGAPAPIAAVTVAYMLGYLATAIPVPGGIGVLEGGLTGTLVLYGLGASQAGAAVLIYHAIAFWVPSLGGLGAYAVLRLGESRITLGLSPGHGRRRTRRGPESEPLRGTGAGTATLRSPPPSRRPEC